MTEQEWLACVDPTKTLIFIKRHRTLPRRVKARKQRLFAVACCRRLRPFLDDERGQHCIEVVERFADEQATPQQLQTAEVEARGMLHDTAEEAALALFQLCAKEVDGLHVSTMAISAVFIRQQRDANKPFDPLDSRRSGACPSEERAQCGLIRCMFGPLPFRRVALKRIWNTSTVTSLGQAIYDERAFDRMPILGDALEDAGCDNADVLNHCRQPGEHVRGCWVVDLILGRK